MVFTNHTERNAHRILYVGLDVLTFRNKKKKQFLSGSLAEVDYLSGLNTVYSVFAFVSGGYQQFSQMIMQTSTKCSNPHISFSSRLLTVDGDNRSLASGGVRRSSAHLLFLCSSGDAAESLSSVNTRRLCSYSTAKASWQVLERSSSVHSSLEKQLMCVNQ